MVSTLGCVCVVFLVTMVTVVVVAIRKKQKLVNHAQFARGMNFASARCNKLFEERKRRLFAPLHALKHGTRKKTLRLLEIGVGSGANLSFYPEGTELICVDYNPKFQPYFEATTKKHPHVHGKAFHVCSAEDMSVVADGSVDAVVCVHWFCAAWRTWRNVYKRSSEY